MSGTSPRVPAGPLWSRALSDVGMLAAALTGLWAMGFIPTLDQAALLLVLTGFMLVLGVYAGRCSQYLRVPQITGFILIGALCGPDALHLVGEQASKSVNLVNHIAIGLIALMAGAEMRMEWLKARFKGLSTIVTVEVLLLTPIVLVGVMALSAFGMIPDITDQVGRSAVPLVMVALLIGVVSLANSPMVVMSIIKSLGAKGPVTETALGASVIKDVVVLLCFTLVAAVCTAMQESADAAVTDGLTGMLIGVGGGTMTKIIISSLIGLVIGQGLRIYTNRSTFRLPWLLVFLSLLLAAAEEALHIKPLFCLLAAGFSAENIGHRTHTGTHRLEEGLARVAEPVFVLFFVAAGLKLNLDALLVFYPAVLSLVLIRMGGIWLCLQTATRLSNQEEAVRRYAWTALVPQAGITLSLAAIIGLQFERTWGSQVATLLVAMVAVHELIGPLLFISGLKRSGEAREGAAAAH
jgi:Kef-type K+ transport system membrane component KefB